MVAYGRHHSGARSTRPRTATKEEETIPRLAETRQSCDQLEPDIAQYGNQRRMRRSSWEQIWNACLRFTVLLSCLLGLVSLQIANSHPSNIGFVIEA